MNRIKGWRRIAGASLSLVMAGGTAWAANDLDTPNPRGTTNRDGSNTFNAEWLGHNDLSVALDKPGAWDDAGFTKAEQATIAAARKHGKSAGRLAVNPKQAAEFVRLGYDFVSIAGDVWLLQQAFAAGVETIRRG